MYVKGCLKINHTYNNSTKYGKRANFLKIHVLHVNNRHYNFVY